MNKKEQFAEGMFIRHNLLPTRADSNRNIIYISKDTYRKGDATGQLSDGDRLLWYVELVGFLPESPTERERFAQAVVRCMKSLTENYLTSDDL